MITAQVIADSKSFISGKRITTLQLHYPKFIHGEFMTHRVFSRNASSSRAIPFKKIISDIRKDPAVPIHWGANQSGMQARTELSSFKRILAKGMWYTAMYVVTFIASMASKLGVHKQVVNRMVEPWYNINVLVTSTDWENFFILRDHPDAQPEIAALAKAIRRSIFNSTPKVLKPGEWHLPFADQEDTIISACRHLGIKAFDHPTQEQIRSLIALLVKVSVARCARVSYLTADSKVPTVEQDLKLYEKLIVAEPLHASPAEHQATPDIWIDTMGSWKHKKLHGNFNGWVQNRKLLENGVEAADNFIENYA